MMVLQNEAELRTRRAELICETIDLEARGLPEDYARMARLDIEICDITAALNELPPNSGEANKKHAAETLEEVKKRLVKRTDALEESLFDLEKAATILHYWFGEYEFGENPHPAEAIKYGSGSLDDKGHLNSAKWYMDYRSIVQLINIVNDYVYSSKRRISAALEK